MTVDELVKKFRENAKDVTATGYREHQLRIEYLNPLFEMMGWDVANREGKPISLKDVVHEDTVRVEGRAKAPDYGFRVDGTRFFFVEAKSPAVGVSDPASALQLRRYGWSAKLPISILTDFETLKVYDCRVIPKDTDAANRALIASYNCDEYETKWEEIHGLLSRPAVSSGSLEKFAIESAEKKGFSLVDDAFLHQIENWRNILANEIAKKNKNIDIQSLNSAVQLIIDRIIFLRIAEDRGIEPHQKLFKLCKGINLYESLVGVFQQADARYNSGLFHFTKESGERDSPDLLTPALNISDKTISTIIKSLYRPESGHLH
jgi:hypothetical protein